MDEKIKKSREEIMDSFKGYFPKKYDYSPEELEKQIEDEEKKRNIALGMTGEKIPEATKTNIPEPKEDLTEDLPEDLFNNEPEALDMVEPEIEVPVEENFYAEEIVEEQPGEEIPPVIVPPVYAPAPKIETEPEIPLPSSASVENNVLYSDMKSLDDLFRQMDTDAEDIDYSDEIEEVIETKGHKITNWFFDFLEIFSVCLLIVMLIFSFAFRVTRVDGSSMTDTLVNGDLLLVTDAFYTPTVGDIVVIQNTSLENDALKVPLVKRVIAVGGQSVDISAGGIVTITEKDGTSYELPQDFVKNEPYLDRTGHWEVPEGKLFVMGDNRNGSTDSRYEVGYVDERCVFGKALMRIYPFKTITTFSNPYNGLKFN